VNLNPYLILQARAEARAILFFQHNEYNDLDEALLPLWQHAQRAGIVRALGEHAAKLLIEGPFLIEMARSATRPESPT
jgi:hypothetical protein